MTSCHNDTAGHDVAQFIDVAMRKERWQAFRRAREGREVEGCESQTDSSRGFIRSFIHQDETAINDYQIAGTPSDLFAAEHGIQR